MSKRTIGNKKKRIDELTKELKGNDEVLKKNHENLRNQVQEGLYKLGFPVGSAWYDSMLELMKMEAEETKIKLDNLEVLNPTFKFQTVPRWLEIQRKMNEKNLKAKEENIKEIEKNVKQVKEDIEKQNQRIKFRRIQIIDILISYKVDVSEFTDKVPSYIG